MFAAIHRAVTAYVNYLLVTSREPISTMTTKGLRSTVQCWANGCAGKFTATRAGCVPFTVPRHQCACYMRAGREEQLLMAPLPGRASGYPVTN